MTLKEKNQTIYKYALEFLNLVIPVGMKYEDLEKYYTGDRKDYSSLEDIFEQFIIAAQDYQGMPNYIRYDVRREEIKSTLDDFNIPMTAEKDPVELYRVFREMFGVKSADTKYNAWYRWSNSVVDAAKFMLNFKDADDFTSFVNQFGYNLPARTALPLLISTKIRGIGFASACNVLKELGFTRYSKPDIHMTDIFEALELSDRDPVSVFEAVDRMSEDCREIDPDVTPNKIDKVFWLIASGRYYLDNRATRGHKDIFINKAKGEMNTQ